LKQQTERPAKSMKPATSENTEARASSAHYSEKRARRFVITNGTKKTCFVPPNV